MTVFTCATVNFVHLYFVFYGCVETIYLQAKTYSIADHIHLRRMKIYVSYYFNVIILYSMLLVHLKYLIKLIENNVTSFLLQVILISILTISNMYRFFNNYKFFNDKFETIEL